MGLLWVVDTGNRRVVAINRRGETHSILGAARLIEPVALAIFEDDLFIADRAANSIVSCSLSGSRETTRFKIASPQSIAFDPSLRRLIVAGDTLSFLNVDNGLIDKEPELPTAVCLSPDRRRIYLATKESEGFTSILERSSGKERVLCSVPHDVSFLTNTPAGLLAVHSAGLVGINLHHGTFTTVWKTNKVVRAATALPSKSYAVSCGNEVLVVQRDGGSATPFPGVTRE